MRPLGHRRTAFGGLSRTLYRGLRGRLWLGPQQSWCLLKDLCSVACCMYNARMVLPWLGERYFHDEASCLAALQLRMRTCFFTEVTNTFSGIFGEGLGGTLRPHIRKCRSHCSEKHIFKKFLVAHCEHNLSIDCFGEILMSLELKTLLALQREAFFHA